MRELPVGWDESDFLVSINRQIGPEGRIILRSKTAKEKEEFGRYWEYDYRNDAQWGEIDIDLKDYWLKLEGEPHGRGS